MLERALRIATISALLSSSSPAPSVEIPFDAARWDLAGARVTEHLGRSALAGTAGLKDVELGDGTIEYDVAVTGARSYPGVAFRVQPDGSWERFYIRPHRSGRVAPSLYPDVLQYVPSWNRVDSWQLYSGPGYTAGAVVPAGEWVHVKIEVLGDRARVFVGDAKEPSLDIPRLRHGVRKGGIQLIAPADGSAHFSRFSVDHAAPSGFGPRPSAPPAPGFVKSWQVSQVVPTLEIDDQGPALPAVASRLDWRDVAADENGLVDVARVQGRTGQPDTVFLRTFVEAAQAGVRPYKVGYSDTVALYLNGTKVWSGDSTYQGRDPSFLGILGLNDVVSLPLKAGRNEVVAALGEMSGGWGLSMQDATAELRAPGLRRLWTTGKRFATPESAAYDPARQLLYVGEYDPFHPSREEGRQRIRRLGLEGGEPETLATGLRNPTGLVVSGNSLFAVEARAVVEVALPAGTIVRRIPVPGAVRLNDVDADAAGTLYVSDAPQGVIYRIAGGRAEPWLKGPEVERPNGVCVSGTRLLWANNGDSSLKAADLGSRAVVTVASLPGGLLDGVANGPDGGWLVSHNEGRLFLVSEAGESSLLLDLTVTGVGIADFAVVPGRRMVVFPTFTDGRVAAEALPPARGGR